MSDMLKMIPLSQLRPSRDNVRKTDRLAGIEALARNIQAKGLLQNLIVRQIKMNGRKNPVYEVKAGGRRFAALRLLAKKRAIARDYRVRCMLEAKADARKEVSLAENFMRAPIHPADQFEAFADLVREGLPADDIAARFGVTPTFVEQRLKLAAVSPRLLAEYRAGAMTLEQLTAFTLSEDHMLQEEIWFDRTYADLPAPVIRRLLTKSQVEGTDRRARFVGAQAYEAAGGIILRDLFDADDEGYFTDSQLLDRLVAGKLEDTAIAVRTEGWRWVEVQPDAYLVPLSRYGRAKTVAVPLSETEGARLRELSDRYDSLVESLEEEPGEALSHELDELSVEMSALQRKAETWEDEEKTRAGAIVSLGPDGTLQILRGLLKPEAQDRTATNGSEEPRKKTGRNGYADSVLLDLSAHRTAALRETLASQPDNALLSLIHALVDQIFYSGSSGSCLRIVASAVELDQASASASESKAAQAFQARHRTWAARLPEKHQLWDWLMALDPAERLQLLAVCIAMTADALERSSDESKQTHVSQLVLATGVDMREWWRPTRDNFLRRLTKAEILTAVAEGVSQQATWRLAGFKKDRMTKEAEKLLAASDWLPLPLRRPVEPGANAN